MISVTRGGCSRDALWLSVPNFSYLFVCDTTGLPGSSPLPFLSFRSSPRGGRETNRTPVRVLSQPVPGKGDRTNRVLSFGLITYTCMESRKGRPSTSSVFRMARKAL